MKWDKRETRIIHKAIRSIVNGKSVYSQVNRLYNSDLFFERSWEGIRSKIRREMGGI